MSTKSTVSNTDMEAAFSTLLETPGDETAALVLNHLELSRHAIEWLMQRETSELAGDRYSHDKPHDSRFSRWGTNRGSVAVGGQKLRVDVPRIRDNESQTTHTPEIYARLQQMAGPPLHIMRALILGLGTRKYRETAETLMESMGLSKSSLSEKFVEHSSEILGEFLNRRLDDETYVAMFIDGKALQNQSMVIAIGVTENRVIQRCQVHKIRNVVSHLSESDRKTWNRKLKVLFKCEDYNEAQSMVAALHAELQRINVNAARSLNEGIDDMFTLTRLGLHSIFGRCFLTTNIIESANSGVARYTRHITRWSTADQRMRWTALALMELEPSWNKIHNYRRLPMLQLAIQNEINQQRFKQILDSKPSRISTRKRT